MNTCLFPRREEMIKRRRISITNITYNIRFNVLILRIYFLFTDFQELIDLSMNYDEIFITCLLSCIYTNNFKMLSNVRVKIADLHLV